MPSIQLSVTNASPTLLPMIKYRTVFYEFNHKALVDQGRSRPDGLDLWVEYNAGSSNRLALPVHVERPNHHRRTRVYFSLQDRVFAGSTDLQYRLHWGGLDRIPYDQRRKSQYQPWATTPGYTSQRTEPFVFFDDLRYNPRLATLAPYADGAAPESLFWDLNGTTWEKGSTSDGEPTLDKDWGSDHSAYIKQLGAYTFPSAKRIRCEIWIDSAASTPDCGIISNATSAATIQGYGWGAKGAINTASVTAYTSGADLVLGSLTGGSLADAWNYYTLDVLDTGAIIYLKGWINYTPLVTTADPTRAYTSGLCGVYVNSSGGSAAINHRFRNFAVELWDGVDDSEYAVTAGGFPPPALPEIFEFGSEFRLAPVNVASPYPQALTYQVRNIFPIDKRRVSLTWKNMHPEEFYELAALVRNTRHGASLITDNIPGSGLGSVSYRIVPGTFRASRDRGEYKAQVQLERYTR